MPQAPTRTPLLPPPATDTETPHNQTSDRHRCRNFRTPLDIGATAFAVAVGWVSASGRRARPARKAALRRQPEWSFCNMISSACRAARDAKTKIVEAVDQAGAEQAREAVCCCYRVSDHPRDLINRPRPLRAALKQRVKHRRINVSVIFAYGLRCGLGLHRATSFGPRPAGWRPGALEIGRIKKSQAPAAAIDQQGAARLNRPCSATRQRP